MLHKDISKATRMKFLCHTQKVVVVATVASYFSTSYARHCTALNNYLMRYYYSPFITEDDIEVTQDHTASL